MRHPIRMAGVLAIAVAAVGILAGRGEALDASLSINPSTNLTDGQSVTVTAKNLPAVPSNVVAVVECGNAARSGDPLPGREPSQTDCYGLESINSGTTLASATHGTATTSYAVHDHGIGANNRRCINGGNFPCLIVVADIGNPPGNPGSILRLSQPICFASECTVRSVTTSPPTSTTSSASTATESPGGAAVPTLAATNAEATDPGTTDPGTTQPGPTVAGPTEPGGTGPGPTVPETTVPALPHGLTLFSATASTGPSSPGRTSTTTQPGTMPSTGLPPSTWLVIGLALCLVNIGSFVCWATRPPHRSRRSRRTKGNPSVLTLAAGARRAQGVPKPGGGRTCSAGSRDS